MAIAVTALGTAINNKGAGAAVLNLTGGVTAGDIIIVKWAGDVIASTTTYYHTLMRSAVAYDNSVVDVVASNGSGAVAQVHRIVVDGTKAWDGSYPYLYFSPSASAAGAITAYKVTGLAASPLDKTATNTGTGVNATVGPTATLTQADEIAFCVTAVEDEIDDAHGTWQTGAGYISGNEQFDATNGGGDASNQQVHSVALIVSATTALSGADNGHDSSNWAACIATYMAVAEGNVTVTPTTAALTTAQYIPVNKFGIIPGVLAQTLSLKNAVTGYGYVPTTLNLLTTKYVPVLKHSIIPATLSQTMTQYAPVLKLQLTPTTLAQVLTEYAPTINIGTVVTPTTLALTTAAFVPVLKFGIIPSTLALITTKYAPVLGLTFTPVTLALATSSFIPVLKILLTPTTLALILTLYAPTASITGAAVTVKHDIFPSACIQSFNVPFEVIRKR